MNSVPSFYDLQKFKQYVSDLLVRNIDISLSLDAIRNMVDFVINNQRSVSHILASREIDGLCREIAHSWIKNQGGILPAPASADTSFGTVILATELARAGGHVELIKDYINSEEFPTPIVVVLSDCFARAEKSLSDNLSKELDVAVITIDATDSGKRLFALYDLMANLNPKKIVLVTHNQDSVSIVAALAYRAPKSYFIHHADHHLCLGVTCPEFTHVDVSAYALCNCRKNLNIGSNRYWPLVLNKSFVRRSGEFEISSGITTCAVGRGEKFAPGEYFYDYASIVPQILSTTQGKHIHIGELSDDVILKIRRDLTERHLNESSFVYIPWVSSVAQALVENNVDLYVVSFPLGGAKSAIEAMAVGLPVLVHKNYRSILTSSYFVVYQEAFAWTDISELTDVLSGLTPEVLARHSRFSRAFFEENYTFEILKRAIRDDLPARDEDVKVPTYYSDGLQAFLDEEREIVRHLNLNVILELKTEIHRMHAEYAKIHTEYMKVLAAYNKCISS